MKTFTRCLVLLACLALAGCDVDDSACWPGPGECWIGPDDVKGVCCLDNCQCGLAFVSPGDQAVFLMLPFAYGCAQGQMPGYSCDADCDCTYPDPGVGTFIDLPRSAPAL